MFKKIVGLLCLSILLAGHIFMPAHAAKKNTNPEIKNATLEQYSVGIHEISLHLKHHTEIYEILLPNHIFYRILGFDIYQDKIIADITSSNTYEIINVSLGECSQTSVSKKDDIRLSSNILRIAFYDHSGNIVSYEGHSFPDITQFISENAIDSDDITEYAHLLRKENWYDSYQFSISSSQETITQRPEASLYRSITPKPIIGKTAQDIVNYTGWEIFTRPNVTYNVPATRDNPIGYYCQTIETFSPHKAIESQIIVYEIVTGSPSSTSDQAQLGLNILLNAKLDYSKESDGWGRPDQLVIKWSPSDLVIKNVSLAMSTRTDKSDSYYDHTAPDFFYRQYSTGIAKKNTNNKTPPIVKTLVACVPEYGPFISGGLEAWDFLVTTFENLKANGSDGASNIMYQKEPLPHYTANHGYITTAATSCDNLSYEYFLPPHKLYLDAFITRVQMPNPNLIWFNYKMGIYESELFGSKKLDDAENSIVTDEYQQLYGYYHIINAESGKALDSMTNNEHHYWSGLNVGQYDFHGKRNQTWQITYLGNGEYTISIPQSGYYLEVDNGVNQLYRNVQLWQRNGSIAQVWKIKPNGDGTYRILSACSDFKYAVVVDKSGITQNNANAFQYTFNETARWEFRSANYTPY